mmetsp:Transcript_51846/g.119203  ORF Transcript_51846/g.119203 Transcript_51846/m.119203 type:complete len:495 (-) Transcript_51846:907-2391(-)
MGAALASPPSPQPPRLKPGSVKLVPPLALEDLLRGARGPCGSARLADFLRGEHVVQDACERAAMLLAARRGVEVVSRAAASIREASDRQLRREARRHVQQQLRLLRGDVAHRKHAKSCPPVGLCKHVHQRREPREEELREFAQPPLGPAHRQQLGAQPQRHLHVQVSVASCEETRDDRAVGEKPPGTHLSPELHRTARGGARGGGASQSADERPERYAVEAHARKALLRHLEGLHRQARLPTRHARRKPRVEAHGVHPTCRHEPLPRLPRRAKMIGGAKTAHHDAQRVRVRRVREPAIHHLQHALRTRQLAGRGEGGEQRVASAHVKSQWARRRRCRVAPRRRRSADMPGKQRKRRAKPRTVSDRLTAIAGDECSVRSKGEGRVAVRVEGGGRLARRRHIVRVHEAAADDRADAHGAGPHASREHPLEEREALLDAARVHVRELWRDAHLDALLGRLLFGAARAENRLRRREQPANQRRVTVDVGLHTVGFAIL